MRKKRPKPPVGKVIAHKPTEPPPQPTRHVNPFARILEGLADLAETLAATLLRHKPTTKPKPPSKPKK